MEFGIFDYVGAIGKAELAPWQIYENHFRQIALAEAGGLDYYLFTEHHYSPLSYTPAVGVYMSAVIQRTSTIRLLPMCYVPPFHDPLCLAEEIAMLDNLARGRLEVGLGRGVRPDEFRRWKLPYGEARDRLLEALLIMRRLWAGESLTFSGKYHAYDDAVCVLRPYQSPHPPLWYAGLSPGSIAWAGEEGLHLATLFDLDDTVRANIRLHREGWEKAGHAGTPKAALVRHVHVAETDAEARAAAAGPVTQFWKHLQVPEKTAAYNSLLEKWQTSYQDFSYLDEQNIAMIGSPSTVIEKIRASRRKTGFTCFVALMDFGALTQDQVLRSIRLFGDQVVPELRRAGATATATRRA